MGEADLPGLEGGDAGREAMDLLAGGHRPGGGLPGQVAVVADPVDGTDRALGLVLVGGGEDRGLGSEVELEQVDAVAEPDQVVAELRGGELEVRFDDEALDRLDQGLEGIPGGPGITHSCSIEHMFGYFVALVQLKHCRAGGCLDTERGGGLDCRTTGFPSPRGSPHRQ